MKGKSELNTRQWNLYNFLKDTSDQWVTQRKIALNIKEYDYDETQPAELFHDSLVRHCITEDIRQINKSGVIQKIVIANSKGIKLASDEEFKKYISLEFAAIFRRLNRIRQKAKKGGLDGQMRIVFNGERDTIEAFIKKSVQD